MKYFGVLIPLLILSSCMEKKPLVIGHRGAMGHETENTLASVQKALDLGVDMIEIDIFNVSTGETVVFHDETLDRLANAGGKIEEWGYFDLQTVVLDGGHQIPLLQDVLKLIDNKVRLNIELKGSGTVERVDFIVNRYVEKQGWALENFLISSFKWDELRQMRAANTAIPIAILTGGDPLEAIEIAKELNAEAINPSFKQLTPENVEAIKDAGFKIYPWTVNEPEDIARMKEFGVDGIITNYPERIN